MPDTQKLFRFCRFGGLSPTKQSQYDVTHPNFHSPPARRGLYAFPEHYIEHFLLSATNNPRHSSGKSQWIKDDNGQRIKGRQQDFSTYNAKQEKNVWSKELQALFKRGKLQQKNVLMIEAMPCPYENDETLGMDVHEYCDNGCPIAAACEENSQYVYLAYLKKPRVFEHQGKLWHHFGEHCLIQDKLKSAGSWVKTTYPGYVEAFQRMQHERQRTVHQKLEWTADLKARLPNVTKGEGAYFHLGPLDHFEVFIERLS